MSTGFVLLYMTGRVLLCGRVQTTADTVWAFNTLSWICSLFQHLIKVIISVWFGAHLYINGSMSSDKVIKIADTCLVDKILHDLTLQEEDLRTVGSHTAGSTNTLFLVNNQLQMLPAHVGITPFIMPWTK